MGQLDREAAGMLTATAVIHIARQLGLTARPIVVAVGVTRLIAAVDLAADAAAAALLVTRHAAASAVTQAVQLLLAAVDRIFVTIAVAFVALGDATCAFVTSRVGVG
jgi:hypothetical protein